MPGLPVLGETLRRAEQTRDARGERETSATQKRFGARLAIATDQLRLVIEQVEVRRRPGHVQVDDVLRLAVKCGGRGRSGSAALGLGAERCQREAAEADWQSRRKCRRVIFRFGIIVHLRVYA